MGQIRKREISDRQRDFVTYLVRENKNATEAARLADMPTRNSRLMI